MGRKRKFGEASGWVSVRVPTSKILEYREAVREFVESKFAIELTLEEDSAFLFFQVPKNRVGEYKVAVEAFVKGLLEGEGWALKASVKHPSKAVLNFGILEIFLRTN